MKWIRRLVVAIATLLILLAVAVYASSIKSDRPVGFQIAKAMDPNGTPMAIGIWYPTDARTWPAMIGTMLMNVAQNAPVLGSQLPLVVISHGNGGGLAAHVDLAMALANAGYVVAAPMHPGDNFGDQSAAGSPDLFSNRTRQLRVTLDYLLSSWSDHGRINAQQIGAFGFSAGGLTVLAAAGALPDLRLIASHCNNSPEFVCDVLKHAQSPLLQSQLPPEPTAFVPDPRIKAVSVAAPGLGFTLIGGGLKGVKVPVQLWSGDLDDKVPFATNAKVIQTALGVGVDFHAVPGAAHMSFLAPCGLLKPPGLCSDPGDFDRKAFHIEMNAKVLAFFDRTVKRS